MARPTRLRKVIAWRALSFVVAGCTAQAFLGRAFFVESWSSAACSHGALVGVAAHRAWC